MSFATKNSKEKAAKWFSREKSGPLHVSPEVLKGMMDGNGIDTLLKRVGSVFAAASGKCDLMHHGNAEEMTRISHFQREATVHPFELYRVYELERGRKRRSERPLDFLRRS